MISEAVSADVRSLVVCFYLQVYVYVCVSVCVRERERARARVCVCIIMRITLSQTLHLPPGVLRARHHAHHPSALLRKRLSRRHRHANQHLPRRPAHPIPLPQRVAALLAGESAARLCSAYSNTSLSHSTTSLSYSTTSLRYSPASLRYSTTR
jgi:hypothetical protein